MFSKFRHKLVQELQTALLSPAFHHIRLVAPYLKRNSDRIKILSVWPQALGSSKTTFYHQIFKKSREEFCSPIGLKFMGQTPEANRTWWDKVTSTRRIISKTALLFFDQQSIWNLWSKQFLAKGKQMNFLWHPKLLRFIWFPSQSVCIK